MVLQLSFRCIRCSFNLLNSCHLNHIISRNISMSQKTLLSFFKPPKASNNVLSVVNSAKETENSSAIADSPKKISSPRHRKRVRQLLDSDDENVEKDQCLNGTSSDSSVRSSQSDSEAITKGNIPHESGNEKSESETVPLRMTARKTMPSPYMKRLLSGIKSSTDESAAKSGTSSDQSVDVEMEEIKAKSSESGDEVLENNTAEDDLETTTSIRKEDGSTNSRKSSSPQKKAETSCGSTDAEGSPSGQTEKVTTSSKTKSQKNSSKKRKKNEEKSPEESTSKKAKQRGRPKKTIESNGKEENEKKKPGSSGKGAKHDSETNTKASVEKSSADKKEKKLIHNFFARTNAPKSSSVGKPPAQKESSLCDTEGNEPIAKPKTTENRSSDVKMKDQEDENSGAMTDIQEEKLGLRDSKKSGSKQKNAGKDGNLVPVRVSPKKQKSDTKKLGKNKKEKSPEVASAKQKKARCAKRIIESDDEEVHDEGKDSNESEKSDLDCGVIEEEPENEVPEKKEKTPVHSFFTPKTKQDKNEKVGSQKESKASKPEEDPVYDPTKRHYHPIDDACWKKGEKVPYLALARTMEEIENISGRLKIVEMLANYFRSVIALSPDDLLHSVYLCVNRIAPEYEGVEMGIGETLLMKAVAQATGRTLDKIKAETAVKGDLGLVAESSRGNQRYMFAPPKLTVASVFAKFKEIALMSGNAAMSKKVDKIQALFVACRHCEARYIIRSLSGKLRIGLAEQSVLAALSQAVVLTPPNQSYPPEILNSSSNMSSESFKKKLDAQTLILKTTYCECPNYDKIIPVILKEGIEGLPNNCYLTPGIPLKPMLAHPTKGINEVLQRFDGVDFTCEFKYDGERAQIHVLESGDVKIYSRNQEDNTSKYPDIISRISKALKPETKSCILDTEAVAWDREAKQILPFQQLSTRKRKDVQESEIKVHVCVVAFDLIFLNGTSLVKSPLKERRRLLRESFTEVENEFMFVHCTDGNTAEVMQEFLEESIKGNCEGLMVKSLEVDASYEIAKRSHNWLKLKKDYLEGIGDTLDLVVIGGYHGRGKRTGAYGGFLLACYDDENEEFQTICKIGTGFKDEKLESHTSFLKEHVINEPKSYFRFDSSLTPDVWFEPVQVWEVKCADLSKSPVHKAAVGIVDPEKGISLRFPRFLRIRDDKKPEDATTASQVARLYNSQEQIQNQKTNESKVDDEDFY